MKIITFLPFNTVAKSFGTQIVRKTGNSARFVKHINHCTSYVDVRIDLEFIETVILTAIYAAVVRYHFHN